MEGKLAKQSSVVADANGEFEPYCKWHRKEDQDILEIHLPDFKREQLKVQISNAGILKISGERSLNGSRTSKFYKQITISNTYDSSAIAAKLAHGWLCITMPKIRTLTNSNSEKQPDKVPESDQNPKPEQNTSDRPMEPQPPRDLSAENANAENKVQLRKSTASAGLKVIVSLAVTAVAAAALAGYVVYMWKSMNVVDEDMD